MWLLSIKNKTIDLQKDPDNVLMVQMQFSCDNVINEGEIISIHFEYEKVQELHHYNCNFINILSYIHF